MNTIGIQTDRDTLNRSYGSLCRNLKNLLADIAQFKADLDQATEAELVALGFTDTVGEVPGTAATLKARVDELNSLRRVAIGEAATGAYDFTSNVRKDWGIGR